MVPTWRIQPSFVGFGTPSNRIVRSRQSDAATEGRWKEENHELFETLLDQHVVSYRLHAFDVFAINVPYPPTARRCAYQSKNTPHALHTDACMAAARNAHQRMHAWPREHHVTGGFMASTRTESINETTLILRDGAHFIGHRRHQTLLHCMHRRTGL